MSKLAHAGARSTVSPAVAIAAAVATASSSERTRSTGTPAGASAAAIRSRAAPNRIARRTFPLALATSGSYAPPLSTPPASRITRPGNESRLFAAAPTLVAFESSYQQTPSRSRTTVSRCGSGSTASIVACTASAGAPASRAVATAARMFSTLWRPASRVRPRSYRSSPPSGARNAAKPSPAKAPHGTAAAPNETTRERTPATPRLGIVAVHDCPVVRALRREEPRLRVAVLGERAVAVQVVGRHVEEAPDPRPEALHPFELEARHLDDRDLGRVVERGDQRRAEVAAGEGPAAGARKREADERRGRALAVRTRDGDHRTRQHAEGELDLAPHRDPATDRRRE